MGDEIVFYPDINISFRVISKYQMQRQNSIVDDSFILADSSESDGVLAIKRNSKHVKSNLTNEVKKLGVIIDRG